MKNTTTHFHLNTRCLRLALIGLVLIGVSLACSLPEAGPDLEEGIVLGVAQTMTARAGAGGGTEGGAVETAIAQTMAAKGEVETSVAQTIAARDANGVPDTPIPPPTNTQSPGDTPIPIPTDTPTITLTPTSAVPQVEVSVNTNCRSGPGDAYDIVGALLKGEKAELIAKDPWDINWYIPNPDRAGAFCWIWGQYASTTGNTVGLPVYTPEPTPTVSSPTPSPTIPAQPSAIDFKVTFRELNPKCCIIEYTITNTGSVTLESYVIDATFGANNWVTARDNFEDLDAAWNKISVKASLAPGSSGYGWVGPFQNDPAGQSVSAWVQVCSANGNVGTCKSKTITFTP